MEIVGAVINFVQALRIELGCLMQVGNILGITYFHKF